MITLYNYEGRHYSRMSWSKRPSVSVRKCLLLSFVILVFGVVVTSQRVRKEPPPILTEVPKTDFSCEGRHAGYYADVVVGCQVYHMCDILQKQYSYLCPGYTLFNQKFMVCDHWHSVDCSRTESYYHLNLKIGQVPGDEDSDTNSISSTQRSRKRVHNNKQSKNKLRSNTSRPRKKKNSQFTTVRPRLFPRIVETTSRRPLTFSRTTPRPRITPRIAQTTSRRPQTFSRPTPRPRVTPRIVETTSRRPLTFSRTTPRPRVTPRIVQTTSRRPLTFSSRTTPRPRVTPRIVQTTSRRPQTFRRTTPKPRKIPRLVETTSRRPITFIKTTPKPRKIPRIVETTSRRPITFSKTTPRKLEINDRGTQNSRIKPIKFNTSPKQNDFKTTSRQAFNARTTPTVVESTSQRTTSFRRFSTSDTPTTPTIFLSPPRPFSNSHKNATTTFFNSIVNNFPSISGRGGGSKVKFRIFESQEEKQKNLRNIKLRSLLNRKRISSIDQRNFTISPNVFTSTTQSPMLIESKSSESSNEHIPRKIDPLPSFLLPPIQPNSSINQDIQQSVSPFLLPPVRGPIVLRGEKQELRTPLILLTRVELPSQNAIPFTQTSFNPDRLSFVRGNRAFFIPSAGLTPPLDTNSVEEERSFHQRVENHMTMIFPKRMAQRRRRPLLLNSNCPQCHPVFLRPNECQPCVIIK